MNDGQVLETTAVFKALSDPNRLRIFAELMQGDSCNCELKETLSLAPNLLSHHLKALSDAGLVRSRRDVVDGRWIYYAVDREKIAGFHAWVTTFFDPTRIASRPVCGPEGQAAGVAATCAS